MLALRRFCRAATSGVGNARFLHGSRGILHQSDSGSAPGDTDAPTIRVTFVSKEGERIEVEAFEGENVLECAHRNEIDLEGACEGSLACSTCHVVLDEASYDSLDEPGDEENDMLDLAFGLTDTSRLGCQVVLTRELDGITCTLPAASRNFYVDGHVPKPH